MLQRCLWMLVVLFVVSGGAVMPSSAAAQSEQSDDRTEELLALAIEAEAEHYNELVTAVKASARAGEIRLTDEAKLAWQRGVLAWQSMRKIRDEGNLKQVHEAMKYARDASRRGSDELFSGYLSPEVKRAAKKYVDGTNARIEALRPIIIARENADLERRFKFALATFNEAKKSIAVDRHGQGWRTFVSSLDSFDLLVLELLWGVRPQY